MNLLMLMQGASVESHPGYHRAAIKLKSAGILSDYHTIPYRDHCNDFKHWKNVYEEAGRIIKSESIDILMMQWFHGPYPDPRPFIEKVKANNPNLLVVTTCGDPFGRWLQRAPKSLVQAASTSDVTFSTSMGYLADTLCRVGAPNVILMPHGVCQERFSSDVERPVDPEFDVIFIGSNNKGRNPFTPLSQAGRMREAMVSRLEKRYGKRFGLFGRGWDGHSSWHGPIPFESQHLVASRSALQVGGFPGSYAQYYLSDRPFISMASGVPFLDCQVDRVDRLATPEKHWLLYSDLTSMMTKIDQCLEWSHPQLRDFGEKARNFIMKRHTHYHRMLGMMNIVKNIKDHRERGIPAPPPALDFFTEDTDIIKEQVFAIRNWMG